MKIWDKQVVDNLTDWHEPSILPGSSGVYEQLNEERKMGRNGQLEPVEEYGTGFAYYNARTKKWSPYKFTITQAALVQDQESVSQHSYRWRGIKRKLKSIKEYSNNYGILGETGKVE